MDAKKLREVEARLHAMVKKVVDAGLYMNDGGDFGVDNDGEPWQFTGGCCLLGAVCLGVPYAAVNYLDRACQLLGINDDEAHALEVGYAGWDRPAVSEQYPDLVRLGRRFRETYYQKEQP